MRGELWQPLPLPTADLLGWIVVCADALDPAPTATVVAVTGEPPRPGLGWPLVIPLPQGALPHDSWVLTTQLHTIPRHELGRSHGKLPTAAMRQIDDALLRVLGLDAA